MTHVAIADVTDVVAIQPGAVVSKVVHRDEDLDVTVFGFDAGEGLTEHRASRTAIVQVLSGRLRFTVEGDEWTGPGPGSRWDPVPPLLLAEEPTVMLLTLLRA